MWWCPDGIVQRSTNSRQTITRLLLEFRDHAWLKHQAPCISLSQSSWNLSRAVHPTKRSDGKASLWKKSHISLLCLESNTHVGHFVPNPPGSLSWIAMIHVTCHLYSAKRVSNHFVANTKKILQSFGSSKSPSWQGEIDCKSRLSQHPRTVNAVEIVQSGIWQTAVLPLA